MFLFILALILFVIGAAGVIGTIKSGYAWPIIVGIGSVLLGLVLLWLATFWTNGPGESKVVVNSIDRSYSQDIITGPQSGFRSPWVDFVEFDNSNQELVYAGKNTPPEYTGGTVNGKEITVSVGGSAPTVQSDDGEEIVGTRTGGSTQGNMDATFVYDLDPEAILAIYKQYPYPDAQARFTKAIIEKQVLSSARQIPSGYTTVDFRGVDRAEAETAMTELLNARLGSRGIEFSVTTIQDVRYPKSVEAALKDVEVANQQEQTARAQLRATEVSSQAQVVEAKAKAEAAIAEATGKAEANRLLSASLTPEVLQSLLIQAYDEGTVFVTDGSGTVLIQK